MNTFTREPSNERSFVGAARENEPTHPVVEIVVPVYNEERVLARSVTELVGYIRRVFDFPVQITIADNASTDATLQIGRELALRLPEVEVLHLERKGRGNALRAAWSRSAADVVAYVDVDLSTDLTALPELLLPLLAGSGDVAIGSRLAPGARVTRGIKRELISRSYNILLRASLRIGISDAQCGFKAARRDVIAPLLDIVQDDGWFFDTELLYLAQCRKLAIREVPVRWVEDRDSRVAIISTVREDLGGIMRLRRSRESDRSGSRRRVGTTRPRRGRRATSMLHRHRRATTQPS